MMQLAAAETPKGNGARGRGPAAITAPAAPAPAVSDTLPTGTYLSEAVELLLQPDGNYLMQEIAGSRQATGRYGYAGGTLTIVDGRGDVGRTTFPLQCRILRTAAGFAVPLGQLKCRAFDGLSFRLAK